MVEDEGQGFNVNYIDWANGGIGLANMKSRVTAIGGNLIIYSLPENGTTITLEVPIKKRCPEDTEMGIICTLYILISHPPNSSRLYHF